MIRISRESQCLPYAGFFFCAFQVTRLIIGYAILETKFPRLPIKSKNYLTVTVKATVTITVTVIMTVTVTVTVTVALAKTVTVTVTVTVYCNNNSVYC